MTNFIRGRCCVFTINNPTAEDEDLFCSSEMVNYCIYGHETGEEETYHLQGYAQFNKQISLKAVKKIFPRAHIERVRGTQQQAIEYCKKDGHFDEFGTLKRHGGKDSTQAKNSVKYADIKESIVVEHDTLINVINNCDNTAQIKYAELIEKYVVPLQEVNIKRKVYWYFGPTGSGKTRTAFEMLNRGSWWMSSENLKWFDGYCGQEDVLIDDFRGDFTTFHFLLRLLDIYPLKIPVKGGFVTWCPKRIFITCPYPPSKVYTGVEDKKQLYRRITQVRYFGNSLIEIMPDHNHDDYEIFFEDNEDIVNDENSIVSRDDNE
ncbi:MAG TPA: hypothetical protein VMR41_00740 [Patescibacteria group bacterium]|nr:hypothetical protein [Patescibacteria group bacterium]